MQTSIIFGGYFRFLLIFLYIFVFLLCVIFSLISSSLVFYGQFRREIVNFDMGLFINWPRKLKDGNFLFIIDFRFFFQFSQIG